MAQSLKSEKVQFDWRANAKQQLFFYAVMAAVAGVSLLRNFGLFGGIRSGKTSAVLSILFLLSRMFKNSRWAIIRATYPQVLDTISSFEKIYPAYSTKLIKRWHRSPSDYFVEFTNGSRIMFMSAKEKSDPEFNFLLGKEFNGVFLEQIEGLSEELWEKAISRCGSWYIDPMPPAFVFWTSNPTQLWPKERLYLPWKSGEMPEGHWAAQINPDESPFVTDDQRRIWKQTYDPINYERFVSGDWDAVPKDNVWAYAFEESLHTTTGLELDHDQPIYLSFDFNVSPMSCIVEQHVLFEYSHVINEVDQKNSDIYQLCDQLLAMFGYANPNIYVSGDATGHNRNSIAKADMNTHYKVIRKKLGLKPHQMRGVLKRNPFHNQSRIAINGWFYHFPDVLIDRDKCPNLVRDLNKTEATPDGGIDKDKYDPHKLDTYRYLIHGFHGKWINKMNIDET